MKTNPNDPAMKQVTQEIKEAYRALYWGQEVVETPNLVWAGNPPEPSHDVWGIDTLCARNFDGVSRAGIPLQLRGINQIENAEAIYIISEVFGDTDISPIVDGKVDMDTFLEFAQAVLDETPGYFITAYPMHCYVHYIDYLRSIGVATSFRGFTVSELQEDGVLKLREINETSTSKQY